MINKSLYLSLGSNLGDKQQNLEQALEWIDDRIGWVSAVSSFLITEPVEFNSDKLFVNCACKVVTKLDIDTAFSTMQSIERQMGRDKKSCSGQHWDRIIDIDLLLAGERVISTPELIVPHPKMCLRTFVLEPLCEIAPELIHPVLGKSIKELLNELYLREEK